MLVELSLPPKELAPNGRYHWAAKARATKSYRESARLAGLVALGGRTAPRWRQATERALFFHPTSRRRDPDNLLASLKAAFDGLVDAGIIADDAGLTHLPPRQERDSDNPRVWISIVAAKREGNP